MLGKLILFLFVLKLADCTWYDCGEGMFSCSDGNCIMEFQHCDQREDCRDGSDEKDCVNKHTHPCTKDQFRCGNETTSMCIHNTQLCDHTPNCPNGEDELNCENWSCMGFQCPNGPCITEAWKCDLESDCPGGEDEQNCRTNCSSEQFTCSTGGCIDSLWKCDGVSDCEDKSDESNDLCGKKTCPSDNFQCKSGECVVGRWQCDGDADCTDGSDEEGCASKQHSASQCSSQEHYCEADRQCIPNTWVCDGQNDCSDGEDERKCSEVVCREHQIRCSQENYCISKHLRCDGAIDCVDGTDELNCNTTKPQPCADHVFDCFGDGRQCVDMQSLCDGVRNCDNGLDEDFMHCKEYEEHDACHKHNCSQICSEQFSGPGYVCSCRDGFKLAPDHVNCIDVNECMEWGRCSQGCSNVPGSYQCNCWEGYELLADGTCKADEPAEILVTHRTSIRALGTRHKSQSAVATDLRDAVAVDYAVERGVVFWSDHTEKRIYSLEQKHKTEKRTLTSAGMVHGIAFDWVHDLLFYTEAEERKIMAMSVDRNRSAIVIQSGLRSPHAIVVDPRHGVIFWSDVGTQAKIERSGMDGSKRQTLVDMDMLSSPYGLAFDYTTNMLFWVDAKRGQLNAVDYNGRKVQQIIQSFTVLPHPFALSVFEDTAFVFDFERKAILAMNKFTGEKPRMLYSNWTESRTIRVRHHLLQPKAINLCAGHPCEHICLPSERLGSNGHGRSYTCVCPPGSWRDRTDHTRCSYPTSSTTETRVSSTPLSTPQTSTPFAAADTGSSKLASGRIAMIVASSLTALAIVILVLVLIIRRRRALHKKRTEFDNPVYRRTTDVEKDDSLNLSREPSQQSLVGRV